MDGAVRRVTAALATRGHPLALRLDARDVDTSLQAGTAPPRSAALTRSGLWNSR
ncbi:hypothetical protein [Streptomyces sp. R33]|uniref:Uncharacterized protein n=1 Tax=Streptomyces sp. R33 TaxID=3238629 RepID=A0AB39Y2T2_9ACTN